MKILIDIGHPAHVHYFKNLYQLLVKSNHTVIVVARDKEISKDLLNAYSIPFINKGKGKNSLTGKLLFLITASFQVYKIAKREKIDFYLSFASPYNALASIFYRTPVITLDDTEHNTLNHNIYTKFSSTILTPKSFKKYFNENQIRFEGTMESAYLHKKYFNPKPLDYIKLQSTRKQVLLRFVSWNATHDISQKGFSIHDIRLLIAKLSQYADIKISSEKILPKEFQEYAIKINPEQMHSYMQSVDLFIGESGSMATEAAYLGTHSIVLNSASNEFGVFDFFSKLKSFYIAKDFKDLLDKSIELVKRDNLKEDGLIEANRIKVNEINLSDFLSWFVSNYPKSHQIMKENPDYQYNFK